MTPEGWSVDATIEYLDRIVRLDIRCLRGAIVEALDEEAARKLKNKIAFREQVLEWLKVRVSS